tara:strand:+ start:85 stop:780 length:696 start_codon:yes stop_codon:yes gene_type:complete
MRLKYFINQKNFFFVFLSLFITFTFGCQKDLINKSLSVCESIKVPCYGDKLIVRIETNKGIILVELNGNSAPITVGNFIDLVNRGVYENTSFHRVINKPIPFIVQGGDPLTSSLRSPLSDYGTGGFIDPDKGQTRYIPLEIKLSNEEKPRYNEIISQADDLSDIDLRHNRGSFAMARSKKLNSASSQFYIALKALPELDGRYSVFGKIIEGIEILDLINEGDLILKAIVLD